MQGLACNVFLSDLTLEFDAVGVVLGHGFHPWKARRPRSIPNPRPVHRQGRTPHCNYDFATTLGSRRMNSTPLIWGHFFLEIFLLAIIDPNFIPTHAHLFGLPKQAA